MINNCYRMFILVVIVFLFLGCALQRPVLYPNNRFNAVGETIAKQDIDECMELASAAGLQTDSGKKIAGNTMVGAASGAAVGGAAGAVAGAVGSGAATGGAGGAAGGFMWGLFHAKEVDPTHKRFVEECLNTKGYKVIGWK